MTLKLTRLLTATLALTAAIVALFSTGGTAQQKVPFRGEHADCAVGHSEAAASRSTGDLRHGGRPADSRRRGRAQGLSHPWSLAFLPDGAHAGDGTRRSPAAHSQRHRSIRSRSQGVPTSQTGGPVGPDGRRPPSSVRDQQLHLSLIRQAAQRKAAATAIARGHWNGTALTDVRTSSSHQLASAAARAWPLGVTARCM